MSDDAPEALPIELGHRAIAEYELNFSVPRPGNYSWRVRVLDADGARKSLLPVAYDPAFGIWWQTRLIDRDTGEDLGSPLMDDSVGVNLAKHA